MDLKKGQSLKVSPEWVGKPLVLGVPEAVLER